jgi:translation initiation factor IF-2
MVLTLNDYLDDETVVQLLGHEFDCEIHIDRTEQERIRITGQTIKQEIEATSSDTLILRSPVVTFMGHVDHGKTSLIDTIRKSNRVAGEAGAITQHIGAFKVKTNAGDVTILDTPGHEAFSEMRSRGANVTDIVILVIAGDEGIKAQTEEAIRQAREAQVPILVALNKCDKPNFDAQKVYRELADRDLLPEPWGGTTITVNCSAASGQGITELLEMIALQAEILELRANEEARARGTVLESEMHKGLGAVATVLVQNGTLRKGDAIVFGHFSGRIKTMQDDHGKNIEEAGPSTPVKITGLSELALAGHEFIVVKSEKEARELAAARAEGIQRDLQSKPKLGSMEKMMAKKESGEKKILALILRADVQGSLEALKNSLLKIHSDKVRIEIVNADIGEISESDIALAAASKATIVGFHTSIESHADELIKQKNVPVYTQDVIYHLIDEVKNRMRMLLDKLEKETDTGEAVVKAVFKSSQLGLIAGCQVTEGTIKRQHLMRQIRGKDVIWKGKIASLKRLKEDVKEVQKGFECGILLEGNSDYKEGDILQAYEITYLEQDL